VDSSNAQRSSRGFVDKLRDRIKELVRIADREVEDIRGSVRFVVMGLRMAVFVPRELVNDNCMRLAASLAYTTLMTLVPVFAIAFVVLSNIGALQQVAEHVQDLLFQHLLPDSTESVREYIMKYATNIHHGKTISVVSAVVLVFTAISLLTTIERALNRIWNSDHSRRFVARVAIYWSAVTLGPLLIGLSIYVSAQVRVSAALQSFRLPFLQATAASFLPVIFSCFAFTIIYLLLPNTRVKWRAAALGGAVSGIVWELAKHGFNFYVANFVSYTKIYGTLGVLPIFLVWVYVSWLIFLFGAELSYVPQNAESIAAIRRAAKQAVPVSARLAVAVVSAVCRRFLNAQPPPTPEEISAEIGFFPAPVAQVARDLVNAGILAAVEGNGTRLLPAVAPDQLLVHKVVSWANSVGTLDKGSKIGEYSTCRPYDRMIEEAVKDTSFATLAARTDPDRSQP